MDLVELRSLGVRRHLLRAWDEVSLAVTKVDVARPEASAFYRLRDEIEQLIEAVPSTVDDEK